jgi:hypothetical protein
MTTRLKQEVYGEKPSLSHLSFDTATLAKLQALSTQILYDFP